MVGHWNGQTVEATARLVPRYLWTTASIDVFVGSRCVLRSGGQLKLISSCRAQFEDSGSSHEVELSWDAGVFGSFPVEVKIDGQTIGTSRAFVRNWPLGLWPAAVTFVVGACFIYLLLR
jgi:hypothetical protein